MNLHISPQRATDELLARPNLRLRVGEQIVDVGALRVATRPDLPRLTGKAVAVLIELVRHAGSTVTRDQLLERVWTGRFTTPDVLNQAITELRRALADDSRPPRYIETIPKVGYRLIARVQVLEPDEGALFIGTAEPSINDDVAPAAVPIERMPAQARTTRRTLAIALSAIAAAAVVALALFARSEAPPAPGTSGASATAATPWRVSEARALTSDPGAERRPHASEVFRGVHARAGCLWRHVHRDAFAVPEHAQLLQRLGLFQRTGRQLGETAQEARAVTVDADVAQRRARARGGGGGRGRIAPPGDGRAREVQRAVPGVQHHLDHVRVGEMGRILQRVGGRADDAVGAFGELVRASVDQGGVDQGLVALHVDDGVLAVQPQQRAGLGEAVAAGGVVRARHHATHAVGFAGLPDAGVVDEPKQFDGYKSRCIFIPQQYLPEPARASSPGGDPYVGPP